MSRGGMRLGAGRPGWHAKTTAAIALDVRHLHRTGMLSALGPTTLQWPKGGTVGMHVEADAVTLGYRFKFAEGWRDISQRVAITRTPCHYGGGRPWFTCPRCLGRVAIVYLRGWPSCRKCARLVYPSQSDDAIGRSWRRTHAILRRLGFTGDASHWYAVRRPKGMREATYARCWAELVRLDGQREDAIARFIARMGWPT